MQVPMMLRVRYDFVLDKPAECKMPIDVFIPPEVQAPSGPCLHSIAAIERDTGLSKDTLRVWQRRYGFPNPLRSALGERAYPDEQLHRLRLIKRLLDAGFRPGHVVRLAEADLAALVIQLGQATKAKANDDGVSGLLNQLLSHDVLGLQRALAEAPARMGLAEFISQWLVPLTARVGEAWIQGRLEIFQEHAYTEIVQSVLRSAIAALPASSDGPTVLLATLPSEPHGLGLLMAQAFLGLQGTPTVALGVQTPVWDVIRGAQAYGADAVALSFSGCMIPGSLVEALTELRAKLPAHVELWAGGTAPVLEKRPVSGVRVLRHLTDLQQAVTALQERQ